MTADEMVWPASVVVVLAVIGWFAIDAMDQRHQRRDARRTCFDAGYVEVLRAGDRWYCTRKRAGYDEIIEVKRLQEAP